MKINHRKIQSTSNSPLPSTSIFANISKRNNRSHLTSLDEANIRTIYKSIDKLSDEINQQLLSSVRFQTRIWRKFSVLLQQHWQSMIELLDQSELTNQPQAHDSSMSDYDTRIMRGFEVLANEIVRHRLESQHHLHNLTQKEIKLSPTAQSSPTVPEKPNKLGRQFSNN